MGSVTIDFFAWFGGLLDSIIGSLELPPMVAFCSWRKDVFDVCMLALCIGFFVAFTLPAPIGIDFLSRTAMTKKVCTVAP